LDLELKSERYYHPHWEQSKSPLLDALGAIACQLETGSADTTANLATACNWCFTGDVTVKQRPEPISEHETWDGFAAVFTVLAQRYKSELTNDDRDWVKALSVE